MRLITCNDQLKHQIIHRAPKRNGYKWAQHSFNTHFSRLKQLEYFVSITCFLIELEDCCDYYAVIHYVNLHHRFSYLNQLKIYSFSAQQSISNFKLIYFLNAFSKCDWVPSMWKSSINPFCSLSLSKYKSIWALFRWKVFQFISSCYHNSIPRF